MKTWKIVVSIVAALLAIAGIVYVIAAYGDKIAAWARRIVAVWKEKLGIGKRNFDLVTNEATEADFAG